MVRIPRANIQWWLAVRTVGADLDPDERRCAPAGGGPTGRNDSAPVADSAGVNHSEPTHRPRSPEPATGMTAPTEKGGRPPGVRVRGDRVRRSRGDRGMTQQDLASRAGLSLRTIYAVECEQRASTPTIRAIAGALGIEIRTLTEPVADAHVSRPPRTDRS